MAWGSVAARAIRTRSQELYNGCIIRTKSIGCSECHRKTARWMCITRVQSCKKSQTTEPDSDQTFLDPNAQFRGNAGIQGPERNAPSTVSQSWTSQTQSVGNSMTPCPQQTTCHQKRKARRPDWRPEDGRQPFQQTERDRAEVRSEESAHPLGRWC